MYFRNDGLGNIWLDKYLKSPVSMDPLTGNMINEPKQCLNLNDSTSKQGKQITREVFIRKLR